MIDIEKIPEKTWVYLWKNKNRVLYVWKAKNIRKRIKQYFQTWIWVWKEDMVSKADNIDYFLTKNEEEALVLEEKLVKKYNPPYNSLLKWDNSYVYIKIEKWDFPKISFTHYKNEKATYIGPKAYRKDLKDIFKILKSIFKFRTCSQTKFNKWKLCSEYTLWLCKWWCNVLQVSSEKWIVNNEKLITDKSEYKNIIRLIKRFFNWDIKSVQNIILEKIDQAVEKQNFEYANVLKQIYFKLDKLSQNQSVEFDENINAYFIKIKKVQNMYFMIYAKFQDGKIVDLVKLKDNENNFLKSMIYDGLITKYEKISDEFYIAS